MSTLQYIIILILISTYIYIYLKNRNKSQTNYSLNYNLHNKKILSNFFIMYPNLSSREDEDVILSLKQFFIANIESKLLFSHLLLHIIFGHVFYHQHMNMIIFVKKHLIIKNHISRH